MRRVHHRPPCAARAGARSARGARGERRFAAVVAALACVAAGCAGPAPFETRTPGLRALAQEEPWFYGDPAQAAAAMAATERGTLALRVANLFDSYEAESARAERRTGNLFDRSLTIANVVLPLAGTVGGLVLPSDTAKVVASSSAGATGVLATVNLFYNPAARIQRAEVCAAFLRGAVASLHERWDREDLDSIGDSEQEWAIYLAVRSALDVGQQATCPLPQSRWPWSRDEDDEATPDTEVAPAADPAAALEAPSATPEGAPGIPPPSEESGMAPEGLEQVPETPALPDTPPALPETTPPLPQQDD